jgi:carnitine O-acetyltransferase
MSQWKGLFNTCRIPQVNIDRLDIHFKTARESSECPTHMIVMYKYRFYRLETYHQGQPLNITEFYKQLEKIVACGNDKSFGVGIGALTADYRDDWARVRIFFIQLVEDCSMCPIKLLKKDRAYKYKNMVYTR